MACGRPQRGRNAMLRQDGKEPRIHFDSGTEYLHSVAIMQRLMAGTSRGEPGVLALAAIPIGQAVAQAALAVGPKVSHTPRGAGARGAARRSGNC